jgi:hypothetical protein
MTSKEIPRRKMSGISFHRMRLPIFLTCLSLSEYVGHTESARVRNIQITVELIILLQTGIERRDNFSVGWVDGDFMTLHQLRILL